MLLYRVFTIRKIYEQISENILNDLHFCADAPELTEELDGGVRVRVSLP